MSQRTEAEQQADFMDLCGQTRFNLKDVLGDEFASRDFVRWVSLWKRLISEEVTTELFTYVDNLLQNAHAYQTKESRLKLIAYIADGIIDSKYVLDGLGNTMGLPMSLLFDEVHTSNMAKATNEGGQLVIHRRADGKILKPVGWTPPDLISIIREHANR